LSNLIHKLALCESEQVGEGTRIWAFAHVMHGAIVGRDCNIGEGAFVESGAAIGDRVTVKNQVLIWDGVTIQEGAFIGPGVIFTNDLYPRSPRMGAAGERYRDPANWRRPTLVERGASIGAGAVILPGLTVGVSAMVAAGAVVTRNVPPHCLVAGNPARPVGWVCACGGRLDKTYLCPLCGSCHRLVDGRIEQGSR
jgi:acetyltransferase-like isoleucine patch superfamily enzyme